MELQSRTGEKQTESPASAEPELPPHYTRQPWWVMFVAAAVVGLIPIFRYNSVQKANTTGIGLPVLMLCFAVGGAMASVPLILRSHIRSAFWSNIVLFGGIVAVAILASCMVMFLLIQSGN